MCFGSVMRFCIFPRFSSSSFWCCCCQCCCCCYVTGICRTLEEPKQKNKTGSMLLKMAISQRMENLASLNSSIPTDRYFHDYLSECVWVCARGYVGGCDPLLPSEETRRPLETAGNWWKQAPAGVASGDPLVLAAEKYHAITRLDSRPYFTRIASVFHPGRIC